MKQYRFNIVIFLVIVIISIFSYTVFDYYLILSKSEEVYSLPEGVILQFDEDEISCNQISNFEIYCLIKTTREI